MCSSRQTSGTPFGDVRSRLADIAGVPGCGFRVERRLLADTDVLGAPPLLRGALLTIARPDDPPPARPDRGAVQLRVVGGVGAGRVIPLGRGQHVVGRAASADVRLDDPGISRSHAVVVVTAEGVTVRDLEPTNRSRLDGSQLPHGRRAARRPASASRWGRRQSSWVSRTSEAGTTRSSTARSTSTASRASATGDVPTVVTFPDAPSRPDHHRMPLLASLAPLVVSAGLAVALASPALLLFALLSPVMLLGQWWSDRRAGRKSYRRLVREHAAGTRAGAQPTSTVPPSRTPPRRHERHPDLGVLEAVVRRRGTRLWERRPEDDDHLVVRVGTATQPADGQGRTALCPRGPRASRGFLPWWTSPCRASPGSPGAASTRSRSRAPSWPRQRPGTRLAIWLLHVLVDAEHHGADWGWADSSAAPE